MSAEKLMEEIKGNLPNGFYQDVHGNYCLSICNCMIVISINKDTYLEPIVEIELLSGVYSCFDYIDRVIDWEIIKETKEVTNYIDNFLQQIDQLNK